MPASSAPALRLRLARYGVRRSPFYGIVLAHATAPRDARALERLGTYCPTPDAAGVKHVELDVARIKHWLGNGVQVSERVGWLLAKVRLVVACAFVSCAPAHAACAGRHTHLCIPRNPRDRPGSGQRRPPAPTAAGTSC
jgi:small subunit ribosomal protein S16